MTVLNREYNRNIRRLIKKLSNNLENVDISQGSWDYTISYKDEILFKLAISDPINEGWIVLDNKIGDPSYLKMNFFLAYLLSRLYSKYKKYLKKKKMHENQQMAIKKLEVFMEKNQELLEQQQEGQLSICHDNADEGKLSLA